MSHWNDFDLEAKIRGILGEVGPRPSTHHFGRAYLTAYQLAVALEDRYPDLLAGMGVSVGGAGTGEPTSLAQYVARELSMRIKKGEPPDFEGAFLADAGIREIVFKRNGGDVRSSVLGSNDLSMFRLR